MSCWYSWPSRSRRSASSTRSRAIVRTISPYSSLLAMTMSPSAWVRRSSTPSLGAILGAGCNTVTALPSPLERAGAADLPLQLHDAVEQRLGSRRAAGNVDVHRYDPVAAAHD